MPAGKLKIVTNAHLPNKGSGVVMASVPWLPAAGDHEMVYPQAVLSI